MDQKTNTSTKSDDNNLLSYIDKLNNEELNTVKVNLENEIKNLGNSINTLQTAYNRYVTSLQAIKEIDQSNKNDELLIPLSSSMYVKGKLHNVEKVTVDIGAGFYVKQDIKKAIGFIERRLANIKKNQETFKTGMAERRDSINVVVGVMNKRIQSQRQQTQA